MIYASAQALYCILSEGKRSSTRTPKIICTAIPALITAIYLAYPNPVFHQISYAGLQFYITYCLENLRSRLPQDSKLKKDCNRLLISGTLMTVVAFGIWNVDNMMCDEITAWRETAGPFGFLSQGTENHTRTRSRRGEGGERMLTL